MAMTVQNLVTSQQARSNLRWLAGQSGGDRPLHGTGVHAVDQIGYLNLMHAERIAVLGLRELDYYRKLDRHRRDRLHQTLLAARPPALIISDGQEAPSALVDFCNRNHLPLLGCRLAAGPLIETLEQALAHKDHTSMHGVLMDVLGMGVLITGDSGLGKSELALELISRGHGLVADDVVDIERVSQHAIVGRCPALLQGLLEVRGLGLIDIRTIFGESAVRRRMPIKLIVHLVGRRTMEDSYERLPLQALTETILGIPVRKVAIPVAAGRNIAVLTETAVRTTVLLLRGIDTTREFARRQQALILDQSETSHHPSSHAPDALGPAGNASSLPIGQMDTHLADPSPGDAAYPDWAPESFTLTMMPNDTAEESPLSPVETPSCTRPVTGLATAPQAPAGPDTTDTPSLSPILPSTPPCN